MPEFNLSHVGELVLVGVCESRRVGVDVEEIRPMDDTNMQPELGRSSHDLPRSADGANWQLADLDVPEGYMAAVAVEMGMDRLVYFEWRSGITQ